MRKNKNKSKNKLKKRGISEAQKQAFIKGCQESPLTVGNYAKENKVSQASLYRWAESAGVSLKRTKSTESQERSTPLETKSKAGSKDHKAKKIDKEAQEMSEFDFIYTFKEFSRFIKKIIKEAFLKNKG